MLLTVLLAVLSPALADDDGGWGDDTDDGGFDDPPDEPGPPELLPPPRPWALGGSLQTEEALWLEQRTDELRLAKARQSADLWGELRLGEAVKTRVSGHFEVDPAILSQDEVWGEPTMQEYGWLVQLREAWISGAAGPVELTLGRQVVSWGEGRVLSLVDLLNPRDLREPGQADLEDLRLPVTMARLGVSLPSEGFMKGTHRFELIAIPEADWGLRSPPAGPYGGVPGVVASSYEVEDMLAGIDPVDLLLSTTMSWEHLQPRFGGVDQLQGLARWTWRGRGVDLSLGGGRLLDQRGIIGMPTIDEVFDQAEIGGDVVMTLDHRPYWVLAQTGAAQLPGLLLRWEAAYKKGQPVHWGTILDTSSLAPAFALYGTEADLVQVLVGLSWSGWNGTTVDVDLVEAFFTEEPYSLVFPVDSSAWAVRAAKPFLKERLSLELVATGWGWRAENGWLARAGVAYELSDSLSTSVGAMTLQPGDERGPLIGLDQHDRAWVGARWDF